MKTRITEICMIGRKYEHYLIGECHLRDDNVFHTEVQISYYFVQL